MKQFTVQEVIDILQTFPLDGLLLIESSDGEYGPRPVNTIAPHAGASEAYGVDYPAPEDLKGFPVLRA
jgi:hypothetical protein